MTRPWSAGAATGIGSLPGTDPDEAARLVFGELPELPHVPELPARGPGADMIGRSAALLVDLPVEIAPSGWRLTARPGRELRRARDFLAWDLDAVQARAEGYVGPLKVQATGPWTLAAGLELGSGHTVVSDPGAVRDLAGSLAEGLRQHVAELVRRIPGAVVVLQVDEPSLPAVLAARIATPSGYGTVRAPEPSTVESTLAGVLDVVPAGRRVVHCCAAGAPIALLASAGADAIALDAGRLARADNDALGEAIDAGVALWLGVVPSTGARTGYADAVAAVDRLWSELGFPAAERASRVVPTPACGLAGATTDYARQALRAVREAGLALLEA